MFLLTGTLCFSLAGCVQDNLMKKEESKKESMVIKYSDFSDETKDILEALNGNNIIFYDFYVDNTVKSYIVNLWSYKDNEWKEVGKIGDTVDKSHYRIGINIKNQDCDIITMEENGHTKASYKIEELQFKNSRGSIIQQIESPTDIKMNQEMTLWYKVGTDKDAMEATGDFRKIKCTDGFAVTITFYDKVIKL